MTPLSHPIDSPTWALAGSVLTASLLGSVHCAGMCGGFVCFYTGQADARPWLRHLAYNGGRLISYGTLGGLAGAFGATLDRLGAAAGVAGSAAVVAGALMILWGGSALIQAAGGRLPAVHGPAWLRRPLAAVIRTVGGQPAPLRALVVGLVTTLLPCGFLYAFVTVAAGTGSIAGGALVMSAFWAGTVPMMAGLGIAARRALSPLGRRLPSFTAAALVVIGLLTAAGKFRPHAMPHAHPGTHHVGH
ncbi:MAG TPA: sulfite exporter TauE/SafE family protein [Candidatus Eisenbacteria bacterium]|jgi:hypothetical protein